MARAVGRQGGGVLAVPDDLCHAPFLGSGAVRDGALTRAQLRRHCWRRLFPDVYVHRDVPVTHELRALAAGRLLLPDGVVTGVSAAALRGVPLCSAHDDVEITRWPGGHPMSTSAGPYSGSRWSRGLWHAEPGQFARDRQRLNVLTAAGWRVLFVTAADLHHPERLIARIAAALGVVR
ncbi:hypothetical protein [Modestobacter italicus]|uniref:hypothetical protein n=1 Tax=Modestobacter italicus (strain DSM 44449 / CECT 9708 / BC 501) TaxID=2732864 RepID=UPI0027E0584B|nr:hypothetical protein [Modestobacter italicus]